MKNLIHTLCDYHEPGVFNPWSEYDEQCDIGPAAPDIRCRQLRDYLEPRLHRARILLIAEAAGYQGCRFTGIPITCERMLLDAHKQISSSIILGRQGERTSRPDCTFMTSRPQQDKGMNEPTDTYVWGAIVDNGLDPKDVLLWNIFPFHPHKKSPFSNRTPSDAELAAGLSYAKALLHLGISAQSMRHPANGGASLFRKQFSRFSL